MQKKLIALAIAALGVSGLGTSSVALADTNVTLYGKIDLNLASTKTNKNIVRSTSTYNDATSVTIDGDTTTVGEALRTTKFLGVSRNVVSTSRIGLKGSEDLGGGLKAVFTYEFGSLTPDEDENSIGKTRVSTVGLQGGFGTFLMGRMASPSKVWSDTYNPTAGVGYGESDPLTEAQDVAGASVATGDRVSNALAWLSPNWNGFTAKAAYSFVKEEDTADSTDADDRKQGAISLGADYAIGGLKVGATYRRLGDTAGLGTQDGSKEMGIGLRYDFGVVELATTYQQVKANSSDEKKGRAWSFGANAPVGTAGKVYLTVAGGRAAAPGDATDSNGVEQAVDGNARAYSLAYTHSLSKRTKVYAGYSNHKSGEQVGTSGTNDIVYHDKFSGFNVGIGHSF